MMHSNNSLSYIIVMLMLAMKSITARQLVEKKKCVQMDFDGKYPYILIIVEHS